MSITKGPWTLTPHDPEFEDDNWSVMSAGYYIATCHGFPGDYDETAEDNARAIAAVPDLIEALAKLLECRDAFWSSDLSHMDAHTHLANTADWGRARDALAKATGES